jgi:3-hydroxyisobutyrate dehydrogenase-like beta-hydroxyacid dehydrogenase
MVPADQHLIDVALGENGAVRGMRPGATYIDFSTVSPEAFNRVASEVASAGSYAFDAAVGPGPASAAEGTLTLMVGGDPELVERHRPVLDVLGNRIVHCGTLGAGKAVKIANNMVSGISLLMNAEAMALAVKAGVEPRKLVEVMEGTLAASAMGLKVFPQKVFTRTLDLGFALELMRKDLALASSMATSLGVQTSLAAKALDRFTEACEGGHATSDTLAMVEYVEKEAGVVIT